ncbi:MAG: hypothetical protein U0996_03430 [Planctomycetaceae bacterium]
MTAQTETLRRSAKRILLAGWLLSPLFLPAMAAGQDPGTSAPGPLVIPESVPLIIPTPVTSDGNTTVIPQDPAPSVAAGTSQVSPLPPAAPDASASGPQADGDDEVLLSGPVHEAFAEQFNQDPIPGIVVPRQPPEPIEELPPDVRPDGRQVEWISGYWAWDDDDQDFFWISGIWREVPQGFRWLPGYWNQVEGGYQWVSGTWVSESTAEVQYLETAPPESLELGPVGTAPTVDHIWIPGCWTWRESRYAWRPGYWSSGYSNWIWVPARYLWTPRGYIFCSGYWDYPMARRGVLFAPNRFRHAARWNRGYRFTPQVVIATNLIQWNFWVRPNYRHYYFGDYYGERFARRGLIPWHQFTRQRRHFDPLYCHYNQRSVAVNVNFYDQLNTHFTLLQTHVDRRPVRAIEHSRAGQIFEQWERQPGFREQFRGDRIRTDDNRPQLLARTLQQQLNDPGDFQFVRMDDDVRSRFREEGEQIRTLTDNRRSVETTARLHRDNDHRRLELPQLKNADGNLLDGRDDRRDSKDALSNLQLPPNRRDDENKREGRRESGNRIDRDSVPGDQGTRADRSDIKSLLGELNGNQPDPKDAAETLRLPPVVRRDRGRDSSGSQNAETIPDAGRPQNPAAGGELPRNLRDLGAKYDDELQRRIRERKDGNTNGGPANDAPAIGKAKRNDESPVQLPGMNKGNEGNSPASNRTERKRPAIPNITIPDASGNAAKDREVRRSQTERQNQDSNQIQNLLKNQNQKENQNQNEGRLERPRIPDVKGEVERRIRGLQGPDQTERSAGPKPEARRSNDQPTLPPNLGEALRRQERSRPENRETREPRRIDTTPRQENPGLKMAEPRNRPEPERKAPSRTEPRAERPAREARTRENGSPRERKGKD